MATSARLLQAMPTDFPSDIEAFDQYIKAKTISYWKNYCQYHTQVNIYKILSHKAINGANIFLTGPATSFTPTHSMQKYVSIISYAVHAVA